MRKNHKIIVFWGPVGAGKTTQLNILYNLLKKQYRVRRFFLKSYYKIILDVIAKFAHGYYSVREKKLLLSSQVIGKLIYLILLADFFYVLSSYIVKIYLLALFYDFILVEEYIWGTLTDYLIVSKYTRNKIYKVYIKILSYLAIKKKHILIIVDSSFEVLEERWKKRGTPMERHIYVFLQKEFIRRIIYLKDYYSFFNVVYVDTSKRSIKETTMLILADIEQHISNIRE